MRYFLFFIISYSLAVIVVEQKIFEEFRIRVNSLHESNPHNIILKKGCQLISCIFCSSFWSGLIITFLGFNIFNISYLDPFFGGLASAVVSYWIHMVVIAFRDKFGVVL
jgi:hypothetical protein